MNFVLFPRLFSAPCEAHLKKLTAMNCSNDWRMQFLVIMGFTMLYSTAMGTHSFPPLAHNYRPYYPKQHS